MQFVDAVAIGGTRTVDGGYLIATAKSVRTGVQLYLGDEVGRPDLKIVRVYRAPEQVFAQDSLQSFSHAPITNNHPAENVTADNWKTLSVGEVSTAAKKDGEWVHLPLILKDASAIKSVVDGKRELSAGYTCDLDWTPGTTTDGQAYDAQQRDIRINHLALVDKARAGFQARIGDAWGVQAITDEEFGALDGDKTRADPNNPEGVRHMALKNILVDGLMVETTDAGEAAINKLKGMLDTAGKALETATAAHTTAIAAKDTELGKKDAEIADLKGKVLDASGLDKLVADRSAIVAKAKAIAPTLDAAGKTNADIVRAAVAVKLGDAQVKDKSDDYVRGLFDHLTANVNTADPLRDGIMDSTVVDHTPAATAHAAYVTRMSDAWKGGGKKDAA